MSSPATDVSEGTVSEKGRFELKDNKRNERPVDGVNPLGVLGLGFLGGPQNASEGSISGAPKSERDLGLPPPADGIDIETLTLSQVLKGGPLQTLYEIFLDENLCKEEYVFWLAIEKYKENGSEEKGGDRAEFLAIVNEFLDPNSVLESAVSGQNAQPLLTEAEQGQGRRPPFDIFDSAQLDLWVSMQTETFPRFKRSDLLVDYVESGAFGEDILFKRKKLEDFFGMPITGPLKRSDLVNVVMTAPVTKIHQKKAMKSKGFSGFAFWGDKRRKMRERNKDPSPNSRESGAVAHKGESSAGKKNGIPPQYSAPSFGGVKPGMAVPGISTFSSPSQMHPSGTSSFLAGTCSSSPSPPPSPALNSRGGNHLEGGNDVPSESPRTETTGEHAGSQNFQRRSKSPGRKRKSPREVGVGGGDKQWSGVQLVRTESGEGQRRPLPPKRNPAGGLGTRAQEIEN